MSAPKGNNYWQFRNKHGRDYKYQPEQLWNEFIEYSKWIEDNPLWEEKLFSYQGEIVKDKAYKMRAMTVTAFCLFADIDMKTWENYKNNNDFIHITTRIENSIKSQKFEGAAADLLNPNIIARDLGLADKQQTEHSGEIKTTPPTFIFKKFENE